MHAARGLTSTAPPAGRAAAAAAAPGERAHFIDALRILALGWLLLYHVGMYYVSWDWHVKSARLLPGLEPFMRLSAPWRMSLLFAVSGAATAYLLRAQAPDGAWLRRRAARLLLPLLLGVFVVVPPQSYFEVLEKVGYAGSYLDFMALYLSSYGGFCRVEHGCLIMPTWNHLWFLPYLFVYTVLLWAVCRWRPALLSRAASRGERLLGGAWLLGVPLLWVWGVRLLLGGYGQTHALVDDPYAHAQYLSAFAFGALAARRPGLWRRMQQGRWLALVLALVGWALRLVADDAPAPLRAALVSLHQVAALGAAFGFAHRHFQQRQRWVAVCSEAVFPVYILHQTVVIGLAVALAPLAWPVWVEGPVLLAGTLGLCLGGWWVARRIAWLRPWMGMASRARARLPSGVACAP